MNQSKNRKRLSNEQIIFLSKEVKRLNISKHVIGEMSNKSVSAVKNFLNVKIGYYNETVHEEITRAIFLANKMNIQKHDELKKKALDSIKEVSIIKPKIS